MLTARSTVSRPRPGQHRPAHGTSETTSAGSRSLRLLAFALPPVIGATMVVSLAPTVPAAAGARQASIASTTTARPTVRYGSRGSNVTYLQRRLAALHYDVGSIDGIFGSDTLHGVYAFQKVQRVAVDGIVGPITWSRLAGPYVPRARYNRGAASVEINLTRRVLYLTRSGAVTRILDASPGKSSTPTPTGTFSIYRRVNGWDTSPLGHLWRPNYFYRGYAIHGFSSVPTYAASHGCVRVTIAAMNRTWSQLSIGERVYVYR